MALRSGAFQFGPQPSDAEGLDTGRPAAVSFELMIENADRVIARRGTEPLAVEGRLVTDRVALEPGDIIQLATDHFTVQKIVDHGARSTTEATDAVDPIRVASVNRPAPTSVWPQLLLWALVTLIGVGLAFVDLWFLILAAVGVAGGVISFVRHRRDEKRKGERYEAALAAASTTLTDDLQSARIGAARNLRSSLPGPAGITDLLASELERSARFDGRVAIASGDLGWTPPIETTSDPGWEYDDVLASHDFLAAVPFTVNVQTDVIGIVAPRRAALASARHLLTAAMAQADPDELTIRLHVAPDRQADWEWIDDAPHAQPPSLVGSQPATIVHLFDGGHGYRRGPGAIVLASVVDELGVDCDTVLVIRDDGTAFAEMSEGGLATGLVPHGITANHASALVTALSKIHDPDRGAVESVIDLRTADPAVADEEVIDLRDLTPAPRVERQHPTSIDGLTPVPTSYAFSADRCLVVGEPSSEVTAFVASAAIETATLHPSRPIFVLDRGDRALIRLAQLPSCRRYVAIDDLDAASEMFARLDDVVADSDEPALVVIPDLDRILAFYRSVRADGLALRIEALLRDAVPVHLAASAASDTKDLPEMADRFLVWVFPSTEDIAQSEGLLMKDQDGDHRLDGSPVPGRDLTGAVAALKNKRHQTPTGSSS